jgi:hypothetical protein
LFSPPLRAQFDDRHGSSDGGAILLKACAAALELSRRLAECLADRRQVGKVEHTVPDLLRQRRFGSAQCELFRLKSGGHPREHVSSLSKFWLALSEYRFRIRLRESVRVFSCVKRSPYRSIGPLGVSPTAQTPESRSESFRFGKSSFRSPDG